MSFLARKPVEPTTPQAPSSPPKARRHWRRWALAAVALGAVVLLLPAIVTHTPLLPWVVGIAAGDLKGSLKIESASLGWFSPITARGVELRDEKDRPLLVAPTLTGNRSLLAIALHPTALGEFHLDQPELNLLLRSDGSNVEDVLAKYLASEEPSEGVDVALKVTGGNVLLTDESTGRSWKIKNLELSLSTTAGPNGPLRLETSATIADPQQPATISIKANLGQPAAGKPAANGTATYASEAQVDAQAVPLAILEPLLSRVTAQGRLAGRLSSKIHAQWGGSDPAAATVVEADLAGADLSMAAAALGSDVVQLRRLEGNCRIAGQGDRLEIKQLSADCDVGNISLVGSLDLSGRQTASPLDLALKQTYEIKGRLDLALLARMLPKTLSLRQGMEITTGQVQLALSSRASAPGAGRRRRRGQAGSRPTV